jgi:RND family efflux transporter MFP subunit
MNLKPALAPAVILAVGLVTSAFLLRGQPAAQTLEVEPELPVARVLTVRAETVRLGVSSQGTVAPRTESDLVAQVPGQILKIEAGLEPGAFFSAGDLLAQLDPQDVELTVKRSRAALTRARAEEEYARATLRRQLTLRNQSVASVAIVDESRRSARTAEARRLEAEVDLERAERDLERTRILAPFDGRTRTRSTDVGRFVSVGTTLARVYAVDYAEIRLPVPDSELAYLDLPLGEKLSTEAWPEVVLRARFAGREHRWTGHIVRTEAEIDPRTRMVHVIAQVPRPYERDSRDTRPPLAAGLFVTAEIVGRSAENVIRVPRAALAAGGSVWIVDANNQLQRRPIEILRFERETAIVSQGLKPNERISLLEPRLAREGLAIRPVQQEALARSEASPEPTS